MRPRRSGRRCWSSRRSAVVVGVTRLSPAAPAAQLCVADARRHALARSAPTQAQNAALIAATGVQRGLPARAVTIALATALQESKLVNVDLRRPRLASACSSSARRRAGAPWSRCRTRSTRRATFYDDLVDVEGYENLPITEAAQAVQRSGFPDAYAQHETRSRAWASALTGWSPARSPASCATPPAATRHAVVARVQRDLGGAARWSRRPRAARRSSTPRPSARPRTAPRDWAVAQWAVAVARAAGADVGERRRPAPGTARRARGRRREAPFPRGHACALTLAG